MINIDKDVKPSSKNKSLLQSEEYLFYFLALLFTKKEKAVIYRKLNSVFSGD